MKKILLTGAAGHIGASLRSYLGDKYHFRCLDIKPVENEEDVFVADICDFEALLDAMQGVDAVIHLAANPGIDQPWEDVYAQGIGGTYHVFEAARKAGVKKVIYASSTAVLGWQEMQQGIRVSPEMPVHPTTLYGIGKATGELLARYYGETYQMSIICLRIGSFSIDLPLALRSQDDILRAWCSPEDLAQLVQRCLETDGLGFQVFYGVSDNQRRLWDIENARKLVGFRPKSNSENMLKAARGTRKGLTQANAQLMRAAVLDDRRALESWQGWLEGVDFEKDILDSISYRLLPLVYHNLAGQNVAHPLMAKLKGIYRRAWLENQLSLQKIGQLIAQLNERHIPVMLLDDLTSILRLYAGQGLRRPYSLDILVQPDDVPRLLAFFVEQKIWPKVRSPKRFLLVETPLEFWPAFDLPLSVAWRVFPMVKTHAQALAVWQAGNSVVLGDSSVMTPGLEYHFLRSCLRAIDAGPEAAFFALIDAAWMLRKQAGNVDWVRVVDLARVNHLILPVIETLGEIAVLTEMPKADELLQEFQKLPVSWVERQEHRFIYPRQLYPGFFTRSARRLLMYRRSPKVPGLLGFLRYFQFAWGVSGLRTLPRLLVRRFANAIDPSGRK